MSGLAFHWMHLHLLATKYCLGEVQQATASGNFLSIGG
jgi:hypothetical protein